MTTQFGEATIGGDATLVRADQPVIDTILNNATMMFLAAAVDGNASAAPLLFVRDGLDLIFFCARASRIAAQLTINPAAQSVIWSSAPEPGLGVVLSGRCVPVRDPAQRARALALFVTRGHPLGATAEDNAAHACFSLRPSRLTLVDALATPHFAWQDFPGNLPGESRQTLEALGHRVQIWVRAIRAPFFTAAVVPVLLGGAIAYGALLRGSAGGQWSWPLLLWVLLGAVLANAGTNLINDYGDHKSGADDANQSANKFSGGSRVIQLGLMAPWKVLASAILCFAATILIGLHINALLAGAFFAPTPLLAVGILGCLLGVTYTAGPLRLSYFGLGEVAVGLGFGPVIVLGTSYVLTTHAGVPCPWFGALFAAMPVGVFVMLILWINQFQDAPADAASGKRNWVVRSAERADGGFSFARPFAAYRVFNLLGFGLILLLGALGLAYPAVATPFAWLALLPLPLFLIADQRGRRWVRKWEDPAADQRQLPFELLSVNALTIAVHLSAGALLALGYLLAGLHQA
ncbi:MAG: ubiquinone biosynthesis protein UbiA [Acidocella sp. 20-63-7]|nr:MAG: ubiquinone biosynthesis protein UbiA [Acidocella sp. 20-63-7]HQT46729.1 UbiA family prenyltransferase [Acidocella sp.]